MSTTPIDDTNPLSPNWREVAHGERIADPHLLLGRVVGQLRRDGVEVEFTEENRPALLAAITEICRLLDVQTVPMRYEALVVA
jgi:hypothetical protein